MTTTQRTWKRNAAGSYTATDGYTIQKVVDEFSVYWEAVCPEGQEIGQSETLKNAKYWLNDWIETERNWADPEM